MSIRDRQADSVFEEPFWVGILRELKMGNFPFPK